MTNRSLAFIACRMLALLAWILAAQQLTVLLGWIWYVLVDVNPSHGPSPLTYVLLNSLPFAALLIAGAVIWMLADRLAGGIVDALPSGDLLMPVTLSGLTAVGLLLVGFLVVGMALRGLPIALVGMTFTSSAYGPGQNLGGTIGILLQLAFGLLLILRGGWIMRRIVPIATQRNDEWA